MSSFPSNLARAQALILGCLACFFAGPAPCAVLSSGALSVSASSRGIVLRNRSSRLLETVDLDTTIDGVTFSTPLVRRMTSGAIEITRNGRECSLTERFSRGANPGSLRWEVEIHGQGKPWSAPIHTLARDARASQLKFWTAWSDPREESVPPGKKVTIWRDPLVLTSFPSRRFYYGAPYFTFSNAHLGFYPAYDNLISLPLASLLDPKKDAGISVVFSPESRLLDLTLDTNGRDTLDFAQYFRRISPSRPVRFAIDLVAHEASWRGPLRWMTAVYPSYFQPALETANQLSGTSAYSTFEGKFDAAKFRKIAFTTNWKASFDFPYMGMFLPPVENKTWKRFAGDSGGRVDPKNPAKNGYTSIPNLAAYSRRMRTQGFFVLNYFNAAEFGSGIQFPPPPMRAQSETDLWKDPNDWLYHRLRSALLLAPAGMKDVPPGSPYFTWGHAVVLDCGDAAYQQFLLDQTRRHLARLPASSGICIDRMDWLRIYNQAADDGESWFHGAPARSLFNSWRDFMTKLLPLMHNSGKVVFVNNHVKRIDLLKNIDGIFDEFAAEGPSLNLTAFLSPRRPVLGWTNSESNVRQDPDGFFQRYLYMGAFPMAPFPGNDHSILPSPWVDQQYQDYGPLMVAMQGRAWVLARDAVSVENGAALANLFRVPGGYAIPVVFGGSHQHVRVLVRGLPSIVSAGIFHPGQPDATAVAPVKKRGVLAFNVPLVRGCAMLRLEAGKR